MLTIRKGGHTDLSHIYSAFDMDFDKRELLPKLAIHKGLLHGDLDLLLFEDDASKMTLGYALVFPRGVYGYALLKYFGILPWYREKGVGVQAMRLLHKYYADKQGILAEITVFDEEGKDDYMRKLRKFFARFGYVEVPCDYRLGGAEVELMVKPIKGTADIAPVAHRVIRDFYSRVLLPTTAQRMIDIRRKAEE